jgi:hypothetical protein
MEHRIHPTLYPLLQEYTGSIRQAMAGNVTAYYLEGSIALDEFNPRLSGIDFITILKSRATVVDFDNIQRIHRRMERNFPWKMSGRYLQSQDLGCREQAQEPFLIYHDGKLRWSQHFELSEVTWWILKNHGIAVFGTPPQTLNIRLNMEHLIQVQNKNLNTYWARWTTRPCHILALTSDWGVQWTVLGVLRPYYTIREHKITTKVKAGDYAISHLPSRWHPIIREAIALRENPDPARNRSRFRRAFDAFHFLRYVIESCNQFLLRGA